jgi:hypothetical protein
VEEIFSFPDGELAGYYEPSLDGTSVAAIGGFVLYSRLLFPVAKFTIRVPMKNLVCLVLVLSALCLAKDNKPIEWLTGTLLDVSSERGNRFADGESYRNDVSYYTIDDGQKYIYVMKRTLSRRGDKELRVTVNAPIKFAIQGDGFIVMDDDGKMHSLSLQKRALRNTK